MEGTEYIIEELLGRGSFSIVWKARKMGEPSTQVALKKMLQQLEEKEKDNCLKEISILQTLDHPNVIRYLGSFIEDGVLNLVLELADGKDLSCLLEEAKLKRKLLPEMELWNFFHQITNGLNHLHSKRIIHRDIKPANVLSMRNGTLKLGDLGMGRYLSPQSLSAITFLGTPLYMSPERLNEKPYSYSSDIWSLGCLLYEMASLQSPFYGSNMTYETLRKRITMAFYPPIPSPIYSAQLRRVVDRCLKPNPNERPKVDELNSAAKKMI